jgi:hypothetical protein
MARQVRAVTFGHRSLERVGAGDLDVKCFPFEVQKEILAGIRRGPQSWTAFSG